MKFDAYSTGDVIAFSSDNLTGKMIQKFTDSCVTHVAMVLNTNFLYPDSTYVIPTILIIEAVPEGVVFNFLEKRIFKEFDTIWHLPLSEHFSSRLNLEKLIYFLSDVIHNKYDYIQAVKSALDRLFINYNDENFEKFFCSELVSACLEISGVIPEVNASEVTPIDLCRWNIYKSQYTKLIGHRDIIGYNTLPVKSE